MSIVFGASGSVVALRKGVFFFCFWRLGFFFSSRLSGLVPSSLPLHLFFFLLERLFVLLLLATGLKSALYWVLNFGILCAWMEMGYVLGDISVQGWGGKRWVRWDIHGRLNTDAGLVRSWDVFVFVVGFRDGVVVGVAGQGLSAGREGVANVLMLGAIYGFMAI